MVTEDRKTQGLFLGHSVEHNIDISSLDNFVAGGVVKRKTIRAAVLEQMRRLRLRENAVELPVSALSGGNQQKAALARWLLRDSRLLILDEPTRGVDIGAKREIYELIDRIVHQFPSCSATEEEVMLHATGTFTSQSGECHGQQ